MSQIEFITIIQKMFMLVLELIAPVLLVSVIVGLAISIFQSVIQEATLTFVPKIFAALLTLMLLMPWMLELYITNVQDLFTHLSHVL